MLGDMPSIEAATKTDTIQVNHPSWNYDETGNVIGTVVLKSEIVVLPGGNSYRGTVTIEVFDVNDRSASISIAAYLVSATRDVPAVGPEGPHVSKARELLAQMREQDPVSVRIAE